MQLYKTGRYLEELEAIIDYIAQDNLSAAEAFFTDLDRQIYRLPDMPLICRKSTKSKDENIRDLVFKGYVVPYRISRAKNRIEILGIFGMNEWDLE